MGYTGARVGQALSSAFGNMGDALYMAAMNAQKQRSEEARVAEDQRRYQDSLRMREQDIEQRRQEGYQDLAESRRVRAEDLSMKGVGVTRVPPVSGGLMGDALTLGATAAEAGVPVPATRTAGVPVPGTERTDMASVVPDYLINAGSYDPERDIALQATKARERALMDVQIEKADEMRKRGMTPGGAPIHPETPAPKPVVADPVLVRQTLQEVAKELSRERGFREEPTDAEEVVRQFGFDSYEHYLKTRRLYSGLGVMEPEGGGGAQVGPSQQLPDEVYERLRPGADAGGGLPRGPGMQQAPGPQTAEKKPVRDRMAELKAQGKSYDEAVAILRREGYEF